MWRWRGGSQCSQFAPNTRRPRLRVLGVAIARTPPGRSSVRAQRSVARGIGEVLDHVMQGDGVERALRETRRLQRACAHVESAPRPRDLRRHGIGLEPRHLPAELSHTLEECATAAADLEQPAPLASREPQHVNRNRFPNPLQGGERPGHASGRHGPGRLIAETRRQDRRTHAFPERCRTARLRLSVRVVVAVEQVQVFRQGLRIQPEEVARAALAQLPAPRRIADAVGHFAVSRGTRPAAERTNPAFERADRLAFRAGVLNSVHRSRYPVAPRRRASGSPAGAWHR